MTNFTVQGLQATVMQQAKALEKCSAQLTRLGFSANHADVALSTTVNEVMDTEILDRLFLELSQVTTATTSKELDLQQQLASRDAEIATFYATVQQAHDALQRLWDESNLEPIPYVQEALAATEPAKDKENE